MTDVIYKSVDDVRGLYDMLYINQQMMQQDFMTDVIYKSVDDVRGLYDRCYI